MFLITETLTDVSTVIEESEGRKALYIEGVFLESERKNRNGRIYPKHILKNEVDKYNEKYVKTNRALGELEHPNHPEINPDRVSHRITMMTEEGNNFLGKALILNTPCGNIVKGLLEGNAKIGVSSRGLGTVNNSGIVNDDYQLRTVDIVLNPSAIDAFVDGLMEGEIWVPKNNVSETSKEIIKESSSKDLQEKKLKVFQRILQSII